MYGCIDSFPKVYGMLDSFVVENVPDLVQYSSLAGFIGREDHVRARGGKKSVEGKGNFAASPDGEPFIWWRFFKKINLFFTCKHTT